MEGLAPPQPRAPVPFSESFLPDPGGVL